MQTDNVTTPFGRRTAKLALVKQQLQAPDANAVRPVEKWKVFRDVCEARERLGIQDRALAVLDALLTFFPGSELSLESPRVVFPSNAQLSVRAHGIAETTLRRHLAALVDAGLIQRRDSPNGKRYAHRDKAGEVEQAFGFDLTPLMVRADELAALSQDVAAERMRFKRTKEQLSICRRDVRKLISAAMEEDTPGPWGIIEEAYIAIVSKLSRKPDRQRLDNVLDEMQLLRSEILNHMETHDNSSILDGNVSQNERHIQNSKTETTYESEPAKENKQGKTGEQGGLTLPAQTSTTETARIQTFPLSMVLRACPQISDYGPDGAVAKWRDLMSAAVVIRSMLGVSPSAYQEACEVMGPENAATAMACILERSAHINSAGGYLRDLTRKARAGQFGLGPMLMSLMRANATGEIRSA